MENRREKKKITKRRRCFLEKERILPKGTLRWVLLAGAAVWLLCNLSLTGRILGRVLELLAPFLAGGMIAFVLNVPMSLLEKKLFTGFAPFGKASRRLRRPVSLGITLLLFGGVVAAILFWVLPELARSLSALAMQLPILLEAVQRLLEKAGERVPLLMQWLDGQTLELSQLQQPLMSFFRDQAGNMLGSTLDLLGDLIGGITVFSLGLVFAFYILLQKEKLARQGKKLLQAFLPPRWNQRGLEFLSLCGETFRDFLSGQCLESFLLGSLFFTSMSLLRLPYALMTGLMIAVTSLIPIFGAAIGCLGGALLVWMAEPERIVWFLILFVLLQQLEGNLIYPHVVGSSVGLPAIWVLVAVTLGGSLWGILGMFVAIPLFSVLYALLRREVARREQTKRRHGVSVQGVGTKR